MTLDFPADFAWGSATSAAQIETASAHQFRGMPARDGSVLARTTDHERRRGGDAELIGRFGTTYVCSVDWAGLQPGPREPFDETLAADYRAFFEDLRGRGVRVVLSLHHYAHPTWFEETGGWVWESNLEVYYDYVERVLDALGDLVYAYNTFNEPNTYASQAFYRGVWPPFEQNLTKATRVAGHMAQAHLHVYAQVKRRFPGALVGYTLGTAVFEGKSLRAQATARLVDWWYYARTVNLFAPTDYVGVSYFAYVPFAPRALDVVEHRDRIEALGLRHDDLYAIRTAGLDVNLRRVHEDTGKPVWVMANGVCTGEDAFRQNVLTDYLRVVQRCVREGVPVLGYNVWAPWDNFEWHLGPSYRFGLMRTDPQTLDRVDTGSARWYENVARTGRLETT